MTTTTAVQLLPAALLQRVSAHCSLHSLPFTARHNCLYCSCCLAVICLSTLLS